MNDMRKILLASSSLALALSLVACGGNGGGDPWSTTRTAASAALASPGSADVSADGANVTLAGGNGTGANGCAGAQYGFATSPCSVSASFPGAGRTIAFEWSYSTTDTSGPGADLFGMVVDGKLMPLSDPGGAMTQSGKVEIVAANSLQLYLNCTDCSDGAAQAKVSNLTTR